MVSLSCLVHGMVFFVSSIGCFYPIWSLLHLLFTRWGGIATLASGQCQGPSEPLLHLQWRSFWSLLPTLLWLGYKLLLACHRGMVALGLQAVCSCQTSFFLELCEVFVFPSSMCKFGFHRGNRNWNLFQFVFGGEWLLYLFWIVCLCFFSPSLCCYSVVGE